MDEPTNHLDMPTIDALAIALSDFAGTVIVVSHDQHFVETVCDEYWCVGNRRIKVFDDFAKCRDYSKNTRAPNILPREYSTVNTKIKVDPNANYQWEVGAVTEMKEKDKALIEK
eukprot:UN09986